jgi:hypothetical protein
VLLEELVGVGKYMGMTLAASPPPRPASGPRGDQRTIRVHFTSFPLALTRLQLAFLDALDAAEDLVAEHPACSCGLCQDARGQSYAVELFLACLDG